MKSFLYRIKNSEFLTFNEVLRLKVLIVNFFLFIFVSLSIPLSAINEYEVLFDLLVPIGFALMLFLTFILTVFNLNRFAMHTSIWTVSLLTIYYVYGTGSFFSYMLFFVALTIIIFYQDIFTYLIYGGLVTAGGVIYVVFWGDIIAGTQSLSIELSSFTYQVVLIGFYLVFFIQFLVSDNIYEKLNNEWVKMNKFLENYQSLSHSHLQELLEQKKKDPIYSNVNFQKAISELSVFMNDFFEEEGNNIAEVVEFYFFLHEQDVEHVIEDTKLPLITRKYASELHKYLLNDNTELVSLLFDFSTLFDEEEKYEEYRYNFNLDKLFDNRINKLLSLAILYKYLKTEVTQFDKWGQVKEVMTHEQITELFVSPEFRAFISYEQVNFYLDNQELFDKYL